MKSGWTDPLKNFKHNFMLHSILSSLIGCSNFYTNQKAYKQVILDYFAVCRTVQKVKWPLCIDSKLKILNIVSWSKVLIPVWPENSLHYLPSLTNLSHAYLFCMTSYRWRTKWSSKSKIYNVIFRLDLPKIQIKI